MVSSESVPVYPPTMNAVRPIVAAIESDDGAGSVPPDLAAPFASRRTIESSWRIPSPPPKTYNESSSTAAAASWNAFGSAVSVWTEGPRIEPTRAVDTLDASRPPANTTVSPIAPAAGSATAWLSIRTGASRYRAGLRGGRDGRRGGRVEVVVPGERRALRV